MKKILIPLVAVLAIIVFFGYKKTDSQQEAPIQKESKAVPIEVRTASDSKALSETQIFPATVTGDQEATVTAKSAGTIKELRFDIGKYVTERQLLVRIDDTGNNLSSGQNNFQSAEIQQLEQAQRIAKESLELAQKNYKVIDSYATRAARDIAKRQYESAVIALRSALDNKLVTAPISGTVTSRTVSLGDSVTQGQTIATISKLGKLKVRFFVDQDQLGYLSIGLPLKLIDNNNAIYPANISNLSLQADPATKKFLVEAVPLEKGGLLSGTIINVSLESTRKPTDQNSLLLPLSAITVGQNESYLFILENGQAKKINILVEAITGEIAQVKWELGEDTQIIVKGNKTLRDGDSVDVTK